MLKSVQVNDLMEFLFASILFFQRRQYKWYKYWDNLYQVEQKHTIFHSQLGI